MVILLNVPQVRLISVSDLSVSPRNMVDLFDHFGDDADKFVANLLKIIGKADLIFLFELEGDKSQLKWSVGVVLTLDDFLGRGVVVLFELAEELNVLLDGFSGKFTHLVGHESGH